MRKTLIAISIASIIAAPTFARSSQVDGYVKRDGTYVAPHQRTTPNATRTDNWSSRPNTNPYTGQAGRVDPYKPQTKPRGY